MRQLDIQNRKHNYDRSDIEAHIVEASGDRNYFDSSPPGSVEHHLARKLVNIDAARFTTDIKYITELLHRMRRGKLVFVEKNTYTSISAEMICRYVLGNDYLLKNNEGKAYSRYMKRLTEDSLVSYLTTD